MHPIRASHFPNESLVEIVGKVKRPMYYEMKPTETVANLLEYAGGFTGDSYKKAIRLIRNKLTLLTF